MVHQTLPGCIHRVGSVFLRHLGEGWVGSARCVPGAGFNIGQASAPGHYGLNMMHERAETVRAQLTVASQLGHGTEVRLHWSESPKQEAR